jgi:hypothetical protein
VEDRLAALGELGVTDFYGACSGSAATIDRTAAFLGDLARRRAADAPDPASA